MKRNYGGALRGFAVFFPLAVSQSIENMGGWAESILIGLSVALALMLNEWSVRKFPVSS